MSKLTKFIMVLVSIVTLAVTATTFENTTVDAKTNQSTKSYKAKQKIKRYKLKQTKSKAHYRAHALETETQNPTTQPDQTPAWQASNSDLSTNIPWETDNSTGKALTAPTTGDNKTIYYRININAQAFVSHIQEAANRWNALGVINLVQTDDPTKHAIDISLGNLGDNNTNASTMMEHNDAGQFTNENIMLNANSFYLHDTDYDIHVIEHEFGHALGFAHDDAEATNPNDSSQHDYPVMAAVTPSGGASQIVSIGAREANALRQHYNN